MAIARALVHDPKLIVCDEPTSSLDHETGRNVMEILRGVAKSPDRALIVVTHDPRIYEFADRMAHMDDGKKADWIDDKCPTCRGTGALPQTQKEAQEAIARGIVSPMSSLDPSREW